VRDVGDVEDSGDAGAPRVVSRKAPLVEEAEAIAKWNKIATEVIAQPTLEAS
jgi:hypothetical protein